MNPSDTAAIDSLLEEYYPVESIIVEPKGPEDTDKAELLEKIIHHKKKIAKAKISELIIRARRDEVQKAKLVVYNHNSDKNMAGIINTFATREGALTDLLKEGN